MTTIYVKGITEDLTRFILETQIELRMKKKGVQVSQSQTILHLIRECKKISEGKK